MSDLITISFKIRNTGARAHINLPWESGKTVRSYLHSPHLRSYSLIHKAINSGVMDQHLKKMKLNSIPNSGDVIFVDRERKK